MNLLICLLCLICLLNQVINIVGKHEKSNIILSGGGNGCKGSGSGALVMESGGKKGKKNEKLIMKDDTLIMQNGEADGNIIMDGNNLIFKEGKKEENIIIKGNGGQCCQQDIHHKEEHVQSLPIPVPMPHYKKKIEHHHHHSKEVHHHNDDLGLGSRRKDASNNTEKKEEGNNGEQPESSPKRKFKKKMKIRKLKLGDKLSLKEKEHLKLKRVDKRLGLPSFKLAGKMMKKIRWRKNSQKTNSSPQDKPKEEEVEQEQSTKDDVQQENTSATDQQYEDEETEDQSRDQEDETSNSNLYEGLTNSLYPILNPATSAGYMTSGFSNMIDLYPAVSKQPVIVPISSQPTTSASDRRDLKKKSKKNNAKKLKKLNNVKGEDIKKDNVQKTVDEKLDLDQNEEISNDDEEENLKSSKIRSTESKGAKSINHYNSDETTAFPNLLMKDSKFIQPLFAINGRQLTPELYSLLSLTTNVHQRLALPKQNLLDQYHLNHRIPMPTTTLPLFTPAKPNLDRSAALLLQLIGHQSNQQQKLILAQHQKLIEHEAKQKELTMRLKQATLENNEKKLKNLFLKPEYKDKREYFSKNEIYDETNGREKTKLLYENELDHSDKAEEEEADVNKYESIDRSHRRKLNMNKLDQTKQSQIDANVSNDEEFDLSEFDKEFKLESNKRLNRKPPFSRRMYTEPTESEERKLVTNGTTTDNNSTNHSDYKASTINAMKLGRNASLIVYGY